MLKPLFTNTNFQLIHPSLHPILSPYPSHLHGFSPSPSPSPYSSRILSFSPCPYPILCFLSLHPSFSLSFSPLLIPPSLHPSIPPSLLSLHPSILYGNGSFAFYESLTAGGQRLLCFLRILHGFPLRLQRQRILLSYPLLSKIR